MLHNLYKETIFFKERIESTVEMSKGKGGENRTYIVYATP